MARKVFSVLLCALSIGLAVAGLWTTWVHNTLLNTDAWVSATTPVFTSEAGRRELSQRVSGAVVLQVDALSGLPGIALKPLSGFIGQQAENAAFAVSSTESAAQAIAVANRTMHSQLTGIVLSDGSTNLSDGSLRVDLNAAFGPALETLKIDTPLGTFGIPKIDLGSVAIPIPDTAVGAAQILNLAYDYHLWFVIAAVICALIGVALASRRGLALLLVGGGLALAGGFCAATNAWFSRIFGQFTGDPELTEIFTGVSNAISADFRQNSLILAGVGLGLALIGFLVSRIEHSRQAPVAQ